MEFQRPDDPGLITILILDLIIFLWNLNAIANAGNTTISYLAMSLTIAAGIGTCIALTANMVLAGIPLEGRSVADPGEKLLGMGVIALVLIVVVALISWWQRRVVIEQTIYHRSLTPNEALSYAIFAGLMLFMGTTFIVAHSVKKRLLQHYT